MTARIFAFEFEDSVIDLGVLEKQAEALEQVERDDPTAHIKLYDQAFELESKIIDAYDRLPSGQVDWQTPHSQAVEGLHKRVLQVHGRHVMEGYRSDSPAHQTVRRDR